MREGSNLTTLSGLVMISHVFAKPDVNDLSRVVNYLSWKSFTVQSTTGEMSAVEVKFTAVYTNYSLFLGQKVMQC